MDPQLFQYLFIFSQLPKFEDRLIVKITLWRTPRNNPNCFCDVENGIEISKMALWRPQNTFYYSHYLKLSLTYT